MKYVEASSFYMEKQVLHLHLYEMGNFQIDNESNISWCLLRLQAFHLWKSGQIQEKFIKIGGKLLFELKCIAIFHIVKCIVPPCIAFTICYHLL